MNLDRPGMSDVGHSDNPLFQNNDFYPVNPAESIVNLSAPAPAPRHQIG